MRKSELFAHILGVVSEVTEVEPERILAKTKKEEVVDARMLLVYFCRKEGLYPTQIAEWVNVSVRHVNRLMSEVDERISVSGGILLANMQAIRTQLGRRREGMET